MSQKEQKGTFAISESPLFLFEQTEVPIPPRIDRCVRSLMRDPNFKPKKKGQKKRDAAFALCTWLDQQGYLKDSNADEITVEKQILSECDIGSSIIIESEIKDDEVWLWKIPI